tara:strand:+ start:61 stop:234 length:174 start_codon:yes stop_codon:yes gene_type:complete
MVKILKKFYKPFIITYILLTIGLGFYPSFNFFSPKGQLILLGVAFFNGMMGVYIKKL